MKCVAWMKAEYAKPQYRNPRGYFECLLEAKEQIEDFVEEQFVPGQDSSTEIYTSPDGKYKVFMDKYKYVCLCETEEG